MSVTFTISCQGILFPLQPGAGMLHGVQGLDFDPLYQRIFILDWQMSTTLASWGHSPAYFAQFNKQKSLTAMVVLVVSFLRLGLPIVT